MSFMTIRLCRWERLVHRLAIWACFRMTLPGPVTAQAPSAAHPVLQPVAGKWQIEPQTSLAWWQVNPHFNHLWATSCPRDPFWQPGEGASDGSAIDLYSLPNSHSGGRLSPPEEIPLFRRLVVMPLCGQAVAGEVVLPKASSWE